MQTVQKTQRFHGPGAVLGGCWRARCCAAAVAGDGGRRRVLMAALKGLGERREEGF